jgi:hypothetical protein
MSVLDMFFRKKSSFDKKTWYKAIKNIAKLSHAINDNTALLNENIYTVLQQNKKDMFISVEDLINILTAEDLNMDFIFDKCKHVSELICSNYSIVEVYPIVEDDHIVLCPEVKDCPKHNGYKGDKIKIVSIRK